MAAPIESAGISDSAGGLHAASSNETAELPGGAGAGARSSLHATSVHTTSVHTTSVAAVMEATDALAMAATAAARVGDVLKIDRIAG
jgi:hypothetical protein